MISKINKTKLNAFTLCFLKFVFQDFLRRRRHEACIHYQNMVKTVHNLEIWTVTRTNPHQKQPETPVVFLGKGVLKICSKVTGEHPCRSAISIKFQSNFAEITLRHGCSPVNLLHVFRAPFSQEHLWVTAFASWMNVK